VEYEHKLLSSPTNLLLGYAYIRNLPYYKPVLWLDHWRRRWTLDAEHERHHTIQQYGPKPRRRRQHALHVPGDIARQHW
jgi:hypothetical protein